MADIDFADAQTKPVEMPAKAKRKSKKRNPDAISDQQFLAILASEWQQSIGHATDPLASVQDDALARYLGKPYGDEKEGRSQIISRDCAQVVDWALPDLMEPFVSGDNIVEFDPIKRKLQQPSPIAVMQAQQAGQQPPEPVDLSQEEADQATDYVNYVFSVENGGFRLLHDVFKSGLIQKIGIAKIYWDDSAASVQEVLHHVSMLQLVDLQKDDDVEIVNIEEDEIDADLWGQDEGLQAAYPNQQAFKVTLNRVKEEGRLKIVAVPPDEFRISSRAVNIDAYYTAHETETTVSALIEMGFDAKKCQDLPMATYENEAREKLRFDPEYRKMNDLGISDKSRRKVRLLEEHIYCDRNGDGIAECVQVFRVQNTILEEREVPENPYAVFCPSPLPHRLIGESLVDKSKHIQRANTVMWRQALDNAYLANMPRKKVGTRALLPDGSTMQALLNPTVGQIIPCEDITQMESEETPDRTGTALEMMQFMALMRQRDTGVVENANSLSSETLDPKSATQARNEDRQSLARKRLMARVAAEMFLVPLFQKILRAICRYQDYERTVKLRGKWVAYDPRGWDATMSAKISVGLGHPNKDEEQMAAMAVLQVQNELKAVGMIKPEHVYASFKRLIKAVGWRDAEDYCINPRNEKLLETGGQDPKMLEVQGKLQAQQAQMQMDQQAQQQKAELEAQIAQMKAQMDQAKAQMDASMKAHQQQAEAALAIRQQDFEAQLAMRQQAFEERLAERESQHKMKVAETQAANKHEATMSKVQMGGKVG